MLSQEMFMQEHVCDNLKENVDLKKSHTQQLLSPSPPDVKEFKITWCFSAHGFS